MREKALGGRALVTALALALAAIGASAAGAADSGPRTERVSLYPSGEPREYAHHPSISRHGVVVAYQSPAEEQPPPPPDPDPYYPSTKFEVLAYDRAKGKTESISSGAEENGSSYAPSISRDGRFVAFESSSSNLVPGDDDGTSTDVFVRDRRTGSIAQIPDPRPAGDPSISANGRYVAFTSWSLGGQIDLHDRQTGKTQVIANSGGHPSISADGRYVAFQTGDSETGSDILVVDREKHVTETVSVSSKEQPASGASEFASISADGRFVAFESWASNLVRGDTPGSPDIFVRDRKKGTTRCVDVDSQGRRGNGESRGASISASGRYVAFVSNASNLISHDNNGTVDVFVRDRKSRRTRRVSISTSRAPGNHASGVVATARGPNIVESAISGDGHFVAFPSYATNLAPPDAPDTPEPISVFVRGPLPP